MGSKHPFIVKLAGMPRRLLERYAKTRINKKYYEHGLIRDDYRWTREGRTVVLHRQNQPPVIYSKLSIKDTLATAQASRTSFATDEAWQRVVQMYQDGASMIL